MTCYHRREPMNASGKPVPVNICACGHSAGLHVDKHRWCLFRKCRCLHYRRPVRTAS